MEKINVSILGRELTLACKSEERETLQNAIQYADNLMTKIRQASKSTNTERIAIMAAIQLAAELLAVQVGEGPFADITYGELQEKISHIQSLLDEALQ